MDSFLFQSAIYLGSAIICVPIAKKLGLSSVLGYLIAGVAIGPFVLALVGQQGQDVMHVAEFGVVVMLFLIGLELNPSTLWQLRSSIFGVGASQVFITAALILFVCLILGLSLNSSLVIGLTLSLSSTAIVLQSLSEKRQMKTSAGKMSFSVLLFQDLAVIPILALLPFLAVETLISVSDSAHSDSPLSDLPSWVQALAVPLAVFLVVILGKYVLEPLIKVIALTRLRELIVGCALFIVVGISELMILAGISPALGAFLAGLMLANSAFRHQLEADLEPFKGLLLGLFFIAVGASMNFKLILSQPMLLLGLTVGLIILKFIILFALGYITKLSKHQRTLFAITMSQASEFAFVILGLSLQLNITNQDLTEMLIAIVALSMAISPLLNMATERFILSKWVTVIEEKQKENDTPPSHRRVILAGFGDFGSVIDRFMRSNGVDATILDNNADRVELLRKLGFEVYYGDVTRIDLLETAGIADADMLILTISDLESNKMLITHIQEHYPHVKIFVKSANRIESYELIDLGVQNIYRQSFDTALRMGVDALAELGLRKYTAYRAAQKFSEYDEMEIRTLAKLRHDDQTYIRSARKSIEDQEVLLKSDMEKQNSFDDNAWDGEVLKG